MDYNEDDVRALRILRHAVAEIDEVGATLEVVQVPAAG
jgi:hypothetical protein